MERICRCNVSSSTSCCSCRRRRSLLTHPTHQLLHLHIQRRRQSDEGAQARVHWGAGAGLTLLELLVGVGGDAGGVGQGFLAEALSDAGALQPQTQLASDGPPLLVLAGGGGIAHDHQRRAVTNLAPPYMYGNLEMSAETEGGEQHGWLLNEGPVQRGLYPIVAIPVGHAASVKRPALGGRRHCQR